MLCHQARKRLDSFEWRHSDYRNDRELMEHLGVCPACQQLVQAEKALVRDLRAAAKAEPTGDLPLSQIRARAERATKAGNEKAKSSDLLGAVLIAIGRHKFAAAAVIAVLAFIALVPLDFQEKVGYQIAIDGVQKNIATDNPKLGSLLGALGMKNDDASTLLDSLGANQIHFSVGECSETCRLTISDLKTERDVQLMVRAIIDLGCCRIDDIVPIFRSESTSLLGFAAKKLLS